MSGPFSILPLAAEHDRTGFACGVEPLDRYFREQVGQDVKRRATACYVAIELATGKVAGYYTLAAAGVPLGELPESLVKKLAALPVGAGGPAGPAGGGPGLSRPKAGRCLGVGCGVAVAPLRSGGCRPGGGCQG